MNCYNHRTVPAVGICKNCNKGLCAECLTELKNGIACTATCVDEVNSINALISRNKRLIGGAAGNYYRTTFVYFAMSLLFFYAAIVYPSLKLYMLPAGCLFFIMSILTIIAARKYRK